VRVFGSGEAVVVLLAGLASSERFWGKSYDVLGQNARVVAIDPIGFGASIRHPALREIVDARVHVDAVLALARQVQPVLREAALPALRRLSDSVGATAHLTVVDGSDALAVAVVEPTRSDFHVAYRVGARHPLDRGAGGKAVLAGRATGGRPFEPGWVVSTGELQPGAFGVASPLLGVAGIEASVGVLALTDLNVEDVGPKVLRAAGEVARALR